MAAWALARTLSRFFQIFLDFASVLTMTFAPPLAVRRRLHALTGYRCPPFDSTAAREATVAALARACGDEDGALRLEAAAREGALELKRIANRAEAEEYAR